MIVSKGRKFTGTKMELCASCDEVFNNTRAADKHRVVDYKYALVRFPNGELVRVRQERLAAVLSVGGIKVVSEHNEARRCLTPDEMRGIGMNQEKSGAWNGGGMWRGSSV